MHDRQRDGQVAGANITNVSITCTTEAFSSIVRELVPTLDLAYSPASGELYVSTDTPPRARQLP
jgi:hypothetical protein